MQKQWTAEHGVREAYDAFASVYDDFNRDYSARRWTGRLVGKVEESGVGGTRLLDVACGTGKSCIPMLERGWNVTCCDISPGMVATTRSKVGPAVDLFEADMRDLPALGEFDLVWAINDPINYLLDLEDLEATFAGMRRNLGSGGIVLFDINTLVTYVNFFSRDVVVEGEAGSMVWSGQENAAAVAPGMIAEARFEVEGEPELSHVHRQRHFSEAEVLAALDAVGLRCVAIYGELEGVLSPGVDEELHTKAVYLCRHS